MPACWLPSPVTGTLTPTAGNWIETFVFLVAVERHCYWLKIPRIECLVFEQKYPKRSWLPIVCGSWLANICWIVGLHLNCCRPERIRFRPCVTRPNLKWLLPTRNSKLVANWETFWILLVQLRFLYEKISFHFLQQFTQFFKNQIEIPSVACCSGSLMSIWISRPWQMAFNRSSVGST
jgi:hypothetical protein